jgi:N-acetylglutamate synthase-like GNAT family acetyltransferase
MNDTTTKIEIATDQDLQTILELQRRFSNQLGFIPAPALRQHLETGNILRADENDCAAGYLLHRRMTRQKFVHQIAQTAIFQDAQRRHHGLALLRAIETTTKADILQAWCAADIEANTFWRAAGFICIGRRAAKNARGRELLLWRRPLTIKGRSLLTLIPNNAGKTTQFDPHHDFIWNEDSNTYFPAE